MESESKSPRMQSQTKRFLLIPSLCIGLCGLIGLLVTTTIGIPLPFSSVFLIGGVVGLPLGLLRLGRREAKGKPILIAVMVAILLAPLHLPLGIGVGFLLPMFPAHVKAFLSGPDIVQSVMSPDGNFEAYVVERPSIDPPNQALYIQRSDNVHFVSVAKLPEDIDSIQEIHWSPASDIVVFHTRCSLTAVRVPGYQILKIPLGGEWTRHQAGKRSTFSGAGPRVKVAGIEFPGPGSFGYRLEGTDALKTIDMNALGQNHSGS